MKTYTIKDLQENLIQIKCNYKEEANKIWKACGRNDYWNIGDKDTKDYYILCYKKHKNSLSYPTWMPNGEYFINIHNVKETINFSQIDFQDNPFNNLIIW